MRKTRQLSLFERIVLGLLVSCLVTGTGAVSSSLASSARGSDLRVGLGGHSDPANPRLYAFSVFNGGESVAQNVVLKAHTPPGTTFNRVLTSWPEREGVYVEAPQSRGTGQIAVHLGTLEPQLTISVYIQLEIPDEPGLRLDVTALVTSDTPDPNFQNNQFTIIQFTPRIPTVEGIRARGEPFRLEISGQNLALGGYILVLIGSDNVGDATETTVVEVRDEGQTVVVTAPGLKKRVPKGLPVPIYIFNSEGGVGRYIYTR